MRGTHIASPLRRGWVRLLDGARPWGSLVVQPDRFGVTRYRLVVFPPGINEPERRWVRLARGWPMWGALVWLVCEVLLTQVTGPWTALAVSTSVLVAIGVITTSMARRSRALVKSLSVAVSTTIRNPDAEATRERLAGLAVALIEADEKLERGQISATDHELTWWRVYDRIGLQREA